MTQLNGPLQDCIVKKDMISLLSIYISMILPQWKGFVACDLNNFLRLYTTELDSASGGKIITIGECV